MLEPVPIGRAATLRRGRDVTIVALSRLVGESLAAAERLAEEGIEAEVIDPRTLVPLDLDATTTSASHTASAARSRSWLPPVEETKPSLNIT